MERKGLAARGHSLRSLRAPERAAAPPAHLAAGEVARLPEPALDEAHLYGDAVWLIATRRERAVGRYLIEKNAYRADTAR
jgi:hypothetical protein